MQEADQESMSPTKRERSSHRTKDVGPYLVAVLTLGLIMLEHQLAQDGGEGRHTDARTLHSVKRWTELAPNKTCMRQLWNSYPMGAGGRVMRCAVLARSWHEQCQGHATTEPAGLTAPK